MRFLMMWTIERNFAVRMLLLSWASFISLMINQCMAKEHRMSTFMDGPPRLMSPAQDDIRKVVSAGSVIHLPCPVEASDPASLIFEWSKDRRPINYLFGAEQRFRIGHKGTLKIRGTLAEDTGHYVCRAVNGFGSVEINATLIVLADDEDGDGDDGDEGNEDQVDVHHSNFKISGSSSSGQGHHRVWNNKELDRKTTTNELTPTGSKPYFTHLSKSSSVGIPRSVIQRPAGSSLFLKCIVSGHPRPQITWFKNNATITSKEGQYHHHVHHHKMKGRWMLQLKDLRYSDSGNYTCIARNTFGSVNTTFVVEVTDQSVSKPEVLSFDTMNKTVQVGSSITLTCEVRSDQMPHIQWLKRVVTLHPDANPSTSIEQHQSEIRQNTVKLEGESYRILQPTQKTRQREGQTATFLNELFFHEVREEDAGKYICLAANTKGYSSRKVSVVVVGSSPDSKEKNETLLSDSSSSESFSGVIPLLHVAIPAGIGTLTAILVVGFALFQRRNKRMHSRPLPVRITSVTATPRLEPRPLCPKTTGLVPSPPPSRDGCKSVHLRQYQATGKLDFNSLRRYEDQVANNTATRRCTVASDDSELICAPSNIAESKSLFRVSDNGGSSGRDEPSLSRRMLPRRSELLTINRGSVMVSRVHVEPSAAVMFLRRAEKWNHDGVSEGGGMEYV